MSSRPSSTPQRPQPKPRSRPAATFGAKLPPRRNCSSPSVHRGNFAPPWGIRGSSKGHGQTGRDAERGARRPGSGSPNRLRRHQPGSRVRGGRRALREPAQRLLAPAPRGTADLAPLPAGRAVLPARRGNRRHERRLPHDDRVERPAARRLHWLGRAYRGARARVARRLARVRRQGGVPRRLRYAVRARPAGASHRRHQALRPPLDLAGKRRGPVGRAGALVPRARGARERATGTRDGSRRRRGRPRPHPSPPLRRRVQPLVDHARRRARGRRSRRANAPSRARGGGRSRGARARPAALGALRLDSSGARLRELSLARLPRAGRALRAPVSHRGPRGPLVLACGAEDGGDAAAGPRRAAQLRQRLVIGVRRSRPNAFGRRRTPGGAWRRLYSARSMSATARSATAGSKPSALSSSSERSSSTYASSTRSSSGYGGSESSSRWPSRSSALGARSMVDWGTSSRPACSFRWRASRKTSVLNTSLRSANPPAISP